MRGDYLNADRQSVEQSHWGDRTGQVHAATPTRPEQLVNNGFLPTVNFDGAIRSLPLMVVREGGGSSGWTKEKVELVKISCPLLPISFALLMKTEPFAVGHVRSMVHQISIRALSTFPSFMSGQSVSACFVVA
tara:strand:+ start:156 stop:554 length:399 start_codon:yes stop_codon:yes gene_type:complete